MKRISINLSIIIIIIIIKLRFIINNHLKSKSQIY